jgi:hypothetical protein
LWFGGDVELGPHGAEVLQRLPVRGAGVVNLEGPLGTPDGGVVNGAQAPRALAAAGVRVAWVENNHARDLGDDGHRRTLEALIAADIAPAGTTKLGRVTFVGVDLLHGVPPGLGAALDRTAADVLVVGFHVTERDAQDAPTLLPTRELEAAVEVALAHGARIVVAHGTHALARVERREERVIAWGLGNLAFDCTCTQERDGLVLEVELDGSSTAAWVVPVTAGLQGAAATASEHPALIFDLLESLGSSGLRREGARARF